MARWYCTRLSGVQATTTQAIVWDGGRFSVQAGDWLVTGGMMGLAVMTDAEWQALAAAPDDGKPDEQRAVAALQRALATGLY